MKHCFDLSTKKINMYLIIIAILGNNFLPLYAQISEVPPSEITETDEMRGLASKVLANLMVRRSAQVGTLFVDHAATIKEDLRVYGGLSVHGPLHATNLQINGPLYATELLVNGPALFNDNVVVNGTLELSSAPVIRNGLQRSHIQHSITIRAPENLCASCELVLPPHPGNINEVLTTDGTGVMSWHNIGSIGAFVDGGNSFGALATLGTNDNYGVNIATSGQERISIADEGSVTLHDLAGSGDRIVEVDAAGLLKAHIPTGVKNIIYVVQDSPTVAGKYYSNLKDAVDWANVNATTPTAIVLAAGDHQIASTINVTGTWVKAIVGAATAATRIIPSGAMLGQPVFSLNQSFNPLPFLLGNFTITGSFTPGFKTTPGGVAVVTSGDARLILDFVFISSCYRGLQATGGSGMGLQTVIVNNCFVVFAGDCGILVDNGGRIICNDTIITGSGTQQARIERTNALAAQTQLMMSGGQLSNEATGLGDGILAKDVSLVRINNVRAHSLENIFTVQDSARIECTNNIEVKGSSTHYRQMSPTALMVVSGDVVYGHDMSKFVITNSANVSFNIIDAQNGERCFGSFTDQDNYLFTILTGHGDDDPYYHYENNWFGLRGLVEDLPEGALSDVDGGMKTLATANKDACLVSLVRGLNAHAFCPCLQLSTYQSDGDPSAADMALLRRWTLHKEPSTHNLDIKFWNGATDNSGLTITPTGNVGIGTTTPHSKLELGSGQLALSAGTAANPSLAYAADLDTGMYFPADDVIGFGTSGAQRMTIGSTGIITIPGLAVAGVMHTDASGNVSTSPIVNSDITNLTITDAKLSPIVTAGKVANSATTATHENNSSTIVARDIAGNFAAGTITANLTGNVVGNVTGTVTGQSTLNVLKAGDTMTGPLTLSGGASDLTVGGHTVLQSLQTMGYLDVQGNINFEQGIPGVAENVLIVTKGALRSPHEFNTIADALASITDNSSTNMYNIKVGPGRFIEDTLVMKPYVSLEGETAYTTIIQVDDPSKDVLVGAPVCEISYVTFEGATDPGKAAIVYHGGGWFRVTECIFGKNDIILNQNATVGPLCASRFGSCEINADSDFTTAFKEVADGPIPSFIKCDDITWIAFSNPNLDAVFDLSGPYAYLVGTDMTFGAFTTLGNGTGIKLSNGVGVSLNASIFSGFDKGLYMPNVGYGPSIIISSVYARNNVIDLDVQNPLTTGIISSVFAKEKTNIVPLTPGTTGLRLFFSDSTLGTLTVGPQYVGDTIETVTNISVAVQQGASLGGITGGELSDGGGLDVDVAAGTGYVMTGTFPDDHLKYVTWAGQTVTVPANADNFLYINSDGVAQTALARPDVTATILLGKVRTTGSGISFFQHILKDAKHTASNIDKSWRLGLGPVYKSGSLVTKNGTVQLDVSSGSYFFGTLNYQPAGGTAINWDAFYRNGSGDFTIVNQSSVDYDHYDDGSGTLASVAADEFARHALYVVNDGAGEKYLFVYAQTTYSTLLNAQNGTIPTAPSAWTDNIALIASIIVKNSATAGERIYEIRDERPRLGFKASGIAAVSDHGDLTGLSNDDHMQYLLVNGTRAMSGSLNMGTNNITNVGTVDGVDVSAHAARHLPGGADALTVGAPVSISTSNAEGSANAFARADHVHAHGNLAGGSLHAVATTSTAGFMSAADKTLLDTIDPTLYVLKAGSTMTGALNINTSSDALVISTNKFMVNGTSGNTTIGGTLTLSPLTTAGLLHNNTSGVVISSLILDADVDPSAAIADSKLATIATNGKVANTATTAASANTASAIVARDGSGNFNASNITLENQGQVRLREQTLSGTKYIALQAPATVSTSYTLTLPDSAGTSGYIMTTNGAGVTNWTAPTALSGLLVTGGNTVASALSVGTANDFALNIVTNGTSRIHIADSIGGGAVTLNSLASTGVVHTDGTGKLSTSSIVNADISSIAAIADTKLATIATSGKVANSATTAISSNTPSAIVARDASGNFSAGIITAALLGNVTGSASLNVLKTGDTITGNVIIDNQKQIRFSELTANGSNYVALQAPASLGSDVTLTLPSSTGTANQVLTTDGTGITSWGTVSTAVVNAVVNNGNSFGTTFTIGSNDAYALNLKTNNVNRLNIDTSGNTTFSNNYKAFAYLGSNQSVSGTQTIQFNTESFDPNSNFNTSTYLYTAPVTGYYSVTVNLSATYSNGNTRTLNIIKNGSAVPGYGIQTDQRNPTGFAGLIFLTAGDTLGAQFVNGGGTVVLLANYTSMSINFVSV